VLSGRRHPDLTPQRAVRFRPIFEWHPTEATGLFAAAALGRRGVVEVRDAASRVGLTEYGAAILEIGGSALFDANLLAGPLAKVDTLAAAERVARSRGSGSEIDNERAKSAILRDRPDFGFDSDHLCVDINEQTERANDRNVDYLTVRRLAELLSISGDNFARLGALLKAYGDARYDPPLWRVANLP
jgi:hypothetical protein